MTDPIRLCDAIAALLPALRPASGGSADHRPVTAAVTCRAAGKDVSPPIAAVFCGCGPGTDPTFPGEERRPGAASRRAPSGHLGDRKGGGPS